MVYLSKLTRDDVPKMVKWGKHYDPRFYHYNFDLTTQNGFELWYRSKKKIFYRRIYKVENENREMVGFITIKNIKWSIRMAEMGIVFDPNHLSEGYGYLGILEIFKEYFENMKMNDLFLRVAVFNERGYRAYLKAGFKEIKRVSEPFESQQLKTLLNQQFDGFHLEDGILYCDYIHMTISKEQYFRSKNN